MNNQQHLAEASALLTQQRGETPADLQMRQEVGFVIEGDPAMVELWRKIRMLRNKMMDTLVFGETGTGKEIIPKLIGRFLGEEPVTINCSTIHGDMAESELFGHVKNAFTGAAKEDRPGLFGATKDGGLAVLDEVNHLPETIAPKLLRLFDPRTFKPVGADKEREYGGHVIAMGSDPQHKMLQSLQNRIQAWELEVPALRERAPEHKMTLANFLAAKSGFTLADDAVMRVRESEYRKGNVREMRNLINRATLFTLEREPTLTQIALPDVDEAEKTSVKNGGEKNGGLESSNVEKLVVNLADQLILGKITLGAAKNFFTTFENSLIRAVYDRSGRNVAETARLLGLNRKTVQTRLAAAEIPSIS